MKVTRVVFPSIVALGSVSALGDVTFQEKTQITGGAIVGMMKMAGALSADARRETQPILSSVYLHGNQMARVNDQHTEIIDLDRETITSIDHAKKQYTVMTFAQMKQQLEEAQRKAKEEQAKRGADTSQADFSFDAKVKKTGATRDVAGLSTNEAILYLTMTGTDKQSGQSGSFSMTNDLFLAPDTPGYTELRDFELRLARKLGTMLGGRYNPQLFAMQPGMGKGMQQMVDEMSKLKGVPVLQIMRVGTSANGQPLPAASEAPLPATPAMPNTQDLAGAVANQAAASAEQSATSQVANKVGLGGLASAVGGFGGFGHKKKKADPEPQAAASSPGSQQQTPAAGAAPFAVLMESTTETTNYSRAPVDASHFAVPAGYQQIEPRRQTAQ